MVSNQQCARPYGYLLFDGRIDPPATHIDWACDHVCLAAISLSRRKPSPHRQFLGVDICTGTGQGNLQARVLSGAAVITVQVHAVLVWAARMYDKFVSRRACQAVRDCSARPSFRGRAFREVILADCSGITALVSSAGIRTWS